MKSSTASPPDSDIAAIGGSAAPDAVLWIPHIGSAGPTVYDVAERFQRALDLSYPERKTQFEVIDRPDEKYGSQIAAHCYQAPSATLARVEGKERVAIIDLYELTYDKTLTRRWEEKSLLAKWGLLTWTILIGVLPTLFLVLRKLIPKRFVSDKRPNLRFIAESGRAIRWRDLFQILVALLILTLLVGYLVVLTWAVVDLIFTGSSTVSTAQTLAIVFTALGVAVPQSWRKHVLDAAIDYTTMVQYIAFGARRRAITGQFAELLEHALEKDQYERLHVVGYSFGSLIAIDVLFPPREEPTPGFAMIDALVTIGCPVDLVRAFLPRYYQDRECLAGIPQAWTNIYIPADVLASNFRDDAAIKEATFNVLRRPKDESPAPPPPCRDGAAIHKSTAGEDPTDAPRPAIPCNVPYLLAPGSAGEGARDFLGWLFLLGLNAHGLYWGDRPADADAFRFVVEAIEKRIIAA